ncbi:MAG: hypothetical protein CMC14_08085 [Flavobacteriaceae bacterium]|nr:hypothetical protein [Flavobacteriaceae bacterium]
MKTKHLFAFLFCAMLSIPSAEAQLLKKIKDKVSEVTGSNKKEETNSENEENAESEENTEPDTPTEEEKQANETKIGNFFGGGMEGVPDTYTFSYALTYEMTSGKETNALEYLLEPDAAYFGNKMDDPRANQIIVYDLKKNLMVTFMENDQQKMAMKMRMPNMKKAEKKFGKKIIPEDEEDVQIIPIEGKTILGYQCNGFQVTSKDGVGKFWVTNDAPVSLNGVYANFNSLPKSAKDKALPLNEKSLVMEMMYTANKGKKNNMHMICTQLEENHIEIHKEDYKSGM